MRVDSWEAHAIAGLRGAKFETKGRNLYIVGGTNAQGKSSALTALTMALCGKSGMDWPEVALRDGENEGWVKVELAGDDEELHEPVGLTVELFLRRKRNGTVVEEFRIKDSAGEEAPEPRTLLKRLYDLRAFDPLEFDRLKPVDQKALLQKLIGLDFTEGNAEYDELYSERALANKEVKKLQAQFSAMSPKYSGVPDEEVSSSDLLEELEKRQERNKANKKARDVASARRDLLEKQKAETARLETQIADLQAKLKASQDETDNLSAKLAADEKLCSGLVDQNETEIREQMKGAEAVNAKVRANKARDAALEKLNAAEAAAEDFTKQMASLREKQADALAKAKFPVDGLSFDSDGVLFNGRPIEQASRKERVITSVKIGMALNPRLRLLVCQNGGDLDNDTLDALDSILAENDFQMVLELVTRGTDDENRCQVLIRDGRVVGAEANDEAVPVVAEKESETW